MSRRNNRNPSQSYMTDQNAPSVPLDFVPKRRFRFNPQSNRRLGDPNTHSIDDIHIQSDYLTYLARHHVRGMSKEEKREKEDFRLELERIARETVEGYAKEQSVLLQSDKVNLRCYGSLKSGFGVPGSDLDLLLWFSVEDKRKLGSLPEACKRLLEKAFLDHGYGALLLTKTRVPILRVCQRPSTGLFQNLKAERQTWEDEVEEESKVARLSAQALDPNRLPAVSDTKVDSTEQEKPASIFPLPPSPDRRRPNLEFKDVGIQCDINFSNHVAYYNSELFRLYSLVDYRVAPMGVFIKTWAKTRKINTPYHGTLSSYGFLNMMLHFLMNVAEPPVVPNLQHLALDADAWKNVEMKDVQLFEGHDIRFFGRDDVLMARAREGTINQNHQPIGELLREFFYYFSDPRGFHWKDNVISVRSQGGLRTKRSKNWLESKWGGEGNSVKLRYMLAIEDPFEIEHNIARTVCHSGLKAIRDEFDRAWTILSRMKYSQGRYYCLNPDGNEGDALLTTANDRGDLLRLDQAFYRDKMRDMAGRKEGPQKTKDGTGSIGSSEGRSKRVSYDGAPTQNRGPRQRSPQLMNPGHSLQGSSKSASSEKPRAPLKWEDSNDPVPTNNFETKLEIRSIRKGGVTTIEIPNHQGARQASQVLANEAIRSSPAVQPQLTAAAVHGLIVEDRTGRLEKVDASLDVKAPQIQDNQPAPMKMDVGAPKKMNIVAAPNKMDIAAWIRSNKDASVTATEPTQQSEIHSDTTKAKTQLTIQTNKKTVSADNRECPSPKSLPDLPLDPCLLSDPRDPLSAWNILTTGGGWLEWRDGRIRRGIWRPMKIVEPGRLALHQNNPFDIGRPPANFTQQRRMETVRNKRMHFFNSVNGTVEQGSPAPDHLVESPAFPDGPRGQERKNKRNQRKFDQAAAQNSRGHGQRKGRNRGHRDGAAPQESNNHEHLAITGPPHSANADSAPNLPPASPVKDHSGQTNGHERDVSIEQVKSVQEAEPARETKSGASPKPTEYKSIFGPPIDKMTAADISAQVVDNVNAEMGAQAQVDGSASDEKLASPTKEPEINATASQGHCQPRRQYRKGDKLPSHSDYTLVLSTNDPNVTVTDDEGNQVPYIQAKRARAARKTPIDKQVDDQMEAAAKDTPPVLEQILARSSSPVEDDHQSINTPERPNFPLDPAHRRELAIIAAGGNVCVRDKWN